MKILVLLISFIFSFEASLNELVNIRASKLNEAVYDVNFIAYTFYLLHPKAIRLVKDTFDFYYSKFDDNVDDSPKETTSFTQINGSYYYLACTNKYLVMTLYGETLSNKTKLEKKQSFGYSNEYFSVSSNNQKCTIDTINGKYLFVTYVGKKEGKTSYNIFVFNIGSNKLLTYSHTLNFDSALTLSSSYQQTFGCVSVLFYNYLCLYVENNGLYYFYGDILEKTLPDKIKFDTDLFITEMVISKNHFNPNDDSLLFRYVIGLKDSNRNYYHLPLIVNKTKYTFGSINKISYGTSPSLKSFSGFSKTINDYSPVYFDGSHISIEHISSSRATVSFKPINSFDITFSSIKQPEIISNTYIIITGWQNSYMYVIDFPMYYDEPQCDAAGNMLLGPAISKTIDIASSPPYLTVPSSLSGNQLINRDNQVKISVYSNYKSATITAPDKERIRDIPIIFSFYEENVTPKKVDYLNSLWNKIQSLYYFGNDCMISLSTCYSTCYSCSNIGNATHHLCDTCKKDYIQNGTNCTPKKKECIGSNCPGNNTPIGPVPDPSTPEIQCSSGYVSYEDKCILCPESITSSKKWYYDPSISATSCLYNSSSDCPLNAKYYVPDLKQCFEECPEDYSLYISSRNECFNKCPEQKPYLLEKLSCFDKCPEYSQEVFNKECDCYIGIDDKSKNEIKCKEIKCIDCYNFTISEECKKILMDEYSIDDESDFRYYKTVIPRPNEAVNQIEYKIMVMTDTGIEELNTSLCEDTNFTITVPINSDDDDIEKVISKYEEGYDIFDPNNEFYTDSCISYSEDNVDLTFSERKKYFKNYALCETNCTYLNYNPGRMTVDCNCKFKKYAKTERTYAVIETNEDFNKTDSISSNLMKCMKTLLKNGDLANGAMACGVTISIGEVSLLIYYLVRNSSMFKSLLSAFMLIASPPHRNNIRNNMIDDSSSSDDSYDGPNGNPNGNNEEKNVNDPAPSVFPTSQQNNTYKKPPNGNQNDINSQIIPISNKGVQNNILIGNYNGNNIINGQGNSNNKNQNNNNSFEHGIQNNVNRNVIHKNNNQQGTNVIIDEPNFEINEEEIIRRIEKPNPVDYLEISKSICVRPKLDDKIFDYNFENSQKMKLPYCDYYINLLFYNQMFLFVISKDKWNFFITKISLFFNLILFLMLFNTLFMDESLLNEINQKKRKLCLGKAFGRIIASVLLTILANFILKLLGLLRMEFEGRNWTSNNIYNDEKPHGVSRYAQFGRNNQNNENGISQNNINRNSEKKEFLYYKDKTILKSTLQMHIFLRTIFYFIIAIILSLFITFYVSAFCGMYKKTRIVLFFYCLISFIIIMIYPFILCSIVAGLRHYGLKKSKKLFFNISKKIEWIILL